MQLLGIIKETVFEFFEDGCGSQAAALSYYTVFSLPPLLLIVVSVAGALLDSSAVQAKVQAQIGDLAGQRAAEQIGVILATLQKTGEHRGLATALGGLALLFGATTAFAQLQSALNLAWNVKPDPKRSEVSRFLLKRLVSFGMILCLAFLVLVSLLLSALLVGFSDVIRWYLPGGISTFSIEAINLVLSFAIFSVIFGAIYCVLPDAAVRWKDAWLGGMVTAVLFSGGKLGIGYYLGKSDVTNFFGAAGSLAVILIWTYYASMILLFGAEFTQVWSQRRKYPPRSARLERPTPVPL